MQRGMFCSVNLSERYVASQQYLIDRELIFWARSLVDKAYASDVGEIALGDMDRIHLTEDRDH
jgi:hypothetical protein